MNKTMQESKSMGRGWLLGFALALLATPAAARLMRRTGSTWRPAAALNIRWGWHAGELHMRKVIMLRRGVSDTLGNYEG